MSHWRLGSLGSSVARLARTPTSLNQVQIMKDPTRLQRAFQIIDVCNEDGDAAERWERIGASINGLELTGASEVVRQNIESFGLSCNVILSRCRTDADDESGREVLIEEHDAAGLVELAHQFAIDLRDAETERILDRLREHGRVLPETEIMEMRQFKEWFTPFLINECRTAIDQIEDRVRSDQDDLPAVNSIPFFSLFLFSEWACDDSVDVVLQALRLPGDVPFELFGDGVHEQVHRFLAQFLSDELDRIDELVRGQSFNEYVRWVAAGSYKYIVRDGNLAAEEAIRRLDRLFHETKVVGRGGIPGVEHPFALSSGIVEAIVSIDGGSSSQLSDDDFEYVDEFVVSRGEFFENDGKSELHRLPPTRVEDCVESLRHWSAFASTPDKPKSPQPKTRRRPVRTSVIDPPSPNGPPTNSTRMRGGKAVARNAKCPCGSGRKYKHCCLRSTSDATTRDA